MRKKLTLVSVIFACFFSVNIFAQVYTITVNGKVTVNGQSNNSGITVDVKSYDVAGYDLFQVSEVLTTDINGAYSFSFTTPTLLNNFEIAAIPLYIKFTNNTLVDSINENIPLSSPYADVTYTISKTPVLGAYVPQIGIVTVDSTAKLNKNMIIWERKDDATIARYIILKASSYNGQYDSIGNVSQDVQYTVFRDLKSTPGAVGTAKSFYKIQAVYVNGTKSPLSYPKTSLSLNVTLDGNIPSLSFINKDDIPLFDHGMYKSISVLRSFNSNTFTEFKKFDFLASESSALLEMLSGLQDQLLTSVGKYSYIAIGELVNSVSTHLKSDSGPFSQSMSNLAESELTGSVIVNDLNLSVSPNPSKGKITVTIPEAGNIVVLNSLGQIVSKLQVDAGISQFEIETAGIYTIILNASKAYKTKVAIE
jgi:hypothetical protein